MTFATSIECMLFDLDGTLIDTAPDFVKVLERLCDENDTPRVSQQQVYQTVSNGARALVKLAFNISEDDPDFQRLNEQLLTIYDAQLDSTVAQLYPGMAELLTKLESNNIPWGIVTNKPAHYAEKLLQKLQLSERCGCLICPDHVSERKPHPEPIFVACQRLGCDTERTIYMGDHIRDIQAAKNADVIAVAAAYGYLSADDKVEEWYADFIVHKSEQTESLLTILKFA